jgi:GR25 family glycosyltransferase involved in LPS biosynthesis
MNLNQHFYINLDKRKDRNGETITELRKLGIKKPNRMNATKHKISSFIGCAESHIECIEKAKELNWDYVIIFEDDILIDSKKALIQKINKFINYEFDVLFLGCWNYIKPIEIEKDLAKVVKAVCTHAYIVKSHYYDTLIDNYKEGIKLKYENLKDNKYNCDEYIDILQKKDKWYCITPIHITQRDGWSDHFKCDRNLKNIIKQIPE